MEGAVAGPVRAHHMRKEPSSQPVTSMQLASAFQDRTLTSAACALTRSAGFGLRASQMAMCPEGNPRRQEFRLGCGDSVVMGAARDERQEESRAPSTPHDANTPASLGLHCRSSTDDSCPSKALPDTVHLRRNAREKL